MSSKKSPEKGKRWSKFKGNVKKNKNLLISLAVSAGYLVLIIGLDAVLVSLIHKGDLRSIASWWKGVRVILLLWVFVVFWFARTFKDKDSGKKGVKENERERDINENKKSGNKGASAAAEQELHDASGGKQSNSTETEAEEVCKGQSEESNNP